MAKKPNVLFICTDQQRFDTLGCYGNKFVDTPNLDQIAQKGVLFEKAYCQSPVCTPSRASFLTGRYPRTTRCRGNGQTIPDNERLISRILADYGYYCGLSGKLHLAPCSPDQCSITERRIDDGFHEFNWSHHPAGIDTQGVPESGGCNWTGNTYSRFLFEEGVAFAREPYDEDGLVQTGVEKKYHQTTWCVNKAVECIDYLSAYDKEQPWFYLVNLFDPHHAFDPPKDLLEKYLERMEDLPLPNYEKGELENKPVFQKIDHEGAYNVKGHYDYDNMTSQQHKLIKSAYYAMIELIDNAVGKVIECLNKNNLWEDTIIIFTSDHGEMLGDHGIYLKGPYFYEGLTHVPLILFQKGKIEGGKKLTSIVELTDIVPTILDYCNIPSEPGVQGKSLKKYIEGEGEPHKHIYCEYYEAMPWHSNPVANATMVYDGRYKLCRYHSTDEGELYDLRTDPYERKNLWSDDAFLKTKTDMLIKLSDRMADTVDPLPLYTAKW